MCFKWSGGEGRERGREREREGEREREREGGSVSEDGLQSPRQGKSGR